MKDRSCFTWLLIPGALVLAMVACTPKREAAPTEKVDLKMATRPLMINLPGYIAQEEGFFADARLDVEFVTVGQGLISEVIPPLTSGEIDAATATLSFAHLNAVFRGVNLKAVAEKGNTGTKSDPCAANTFMAPKDLVEAGKLKEVADLRGRKVAANLDSTDGFYLGELLMSGGLTLNDVQAVTLPITSRVDALLGGSIDLGLVSEPQIAQAKKTGKVVSWMEIRDFQPQTGSAVIVYGPICSQKIPA